MAGTFTSLHYHLVFSTKIRFPFLHADLQPRLYEYISGIIRSENGVLLEAGGMPDHLHLLVRLPTRPAISDWLRIIKSKSSGSLRLDSRHVPGEGQFRVAGWLRRVQRQRPEHHRARTFKEEFVQFLKAYEIEYDERYIWA